MVKDLDAKIQSCATNNLGLQVLNLIWQNIEYIIYNHICIYIYVHTLTPLGSVTSVSVSDPTPIALVVSSVPSSS